MDRWLKSGAFTDSDALGPNPSEYSRAIQLTGDLAQPPKNTYSLATAYLRPSTLNTI
jgi:hypothetical protein